MNNSMTPAKLEEIKYNEFIIRKFSHEDGFEAYYVDDIAKIIGIKSYRSSLRGFDPSEIVSNDNKHLYNLATYKVYKGSTRRDDKIKLLTKRGLIRLLAKSRLNITDDLAKFFNINVYEHRFAPIEASTLKIIQEAFDGENMITQYQVSGFRIDLYFTKYKIAVECDEHNHSDRDPEYEVNRENTLKSELNCKFVRYNPNAIDFNIGKVINQIYKIIVNTTNVITLI